jgi:hypothetical protein
MWWLGVFFLCVVATVAACVMIASTVWYRLNAGQREPPQKLPLARRLLPMHQDRKVGQKLRSH